MKNTSRIDEQEIEYFRRLTRNLVFSQLIGHFAECAESRRLTKRQLAKRLGKDPGQISRWLSEPANLTLDSVSDLLLAMEAAMEFKVAPVIPAKSAEDFMVSFREWSSEGQLSESSRGNVIYLKEPYLQKTSSTNNAGEIRNGVGNVGRATG